MTILNRQAIKSVESNEVIQAIVGEVRRKAGPGKRVSFVSGNFNVVHPGHLRLLKFAVENSDFLVVGVNPDHSPGVTLPAEMRLDGVRSIAMVGQAFLLPQSAEAFIRQMKPEIVVKGKEYEARHNPERAAVDSYGGRLIFSSGEMRFSSLGLLERDYIEVNHSNIEMPTDYLRRQGFTMRELRETVWKFSGLRVLVIGDLIVDTYIDCDPLGMSQEDPTIVVAPIEQKTFVGGAGIVAAHAQAMGAEVDLISVCGADETASFARESLDKYSVGTELLVDKTRPTTHKQRYRALGKTLLRVSHLRQHAIDEAMVTKAITAIENRLPRIDLLLFSDFNYGFLPQRLVDTTVELATARGIVMAADSQASSQLSNIARFRGMDLITPTEREARLALQDFESGLMVITQKLQMAARSKNVIVTLGGEGLVVHASKNHQYRDDKLPAFNTAPKDVAGAGDSLFTCASLALCADVDIWRGAYLGALASAVQVSRVGNMPLSLADLMAEIDRFVA